MNKINVLDLFCGAGGLSKGFEMADYNIVLGVDKNVRVKETYLRNHKDSKFINEDIGDLDSNKILPYFDGSNVDLVIGGPPCQGFSMSGKREEDDPRNQLIFHYLRIIEELQPKAFVMENVQGLVNLAGGKFYNQIVDGFCRLGYNVDSKVLIASDYGVPQNRKRIFFIGNRIDKPIKFPEAKTYKITVRDAIDDLPSLKDDLNLDNTILEYTISPRNEYQKFMRKNSPLVYNHQGSQHSNKTIDMISLVKEGSNWKSIPEQFRETQKYNARYTRLDGYKPSCTIDTGHRHHFHYEENRVPTVRESARLQSFPDEFIFYGSKTDQYAQVGNAVPCLLAYEIAKKLKEIF
jgi:DNA (cytosine-5)-methyltransferase 1